MTMKKSLLTTKFQLLNSLFEILNLVQGENYVVFLFQPLRKIQKLEINPHQISLPLDLAPT